MIRVYAYYTREISMLSGDNLSFWQPSPAVSSVRQNLAHPTEENGKEAKTFIVSPAGKTVCEIHAHYCLGRSASSGHLYYFRKFKQSPGSIAKTKETIAKRFLCAPWRRPLLQVQMNGLGTICYGRKTNPFSSGLLSRPRLATRKRML